MRDADRPGETDSAFEQAMRGVKRLDRDEVSRVGRRRRPGPRARLPAGRGRLEVERYGDRVEAVADDGERGALDKLTGGSVPIDVEVDLHGLTEDAARRVVKRTLERAWHQGRRHVVFIHGRGRRSPERPVLRDALHRWLAAPPLAAAVRAFTNAGPLSGSGGATVVALRVRRGERGSRDQETQPG